MKTFLRQFLTPLWRLGRQLTRRPMGKVYKQYYRNMEPLFADLQISQKLNNETASQPWLSLITPIYNTPPRYLDDLIQSFQSQNIKGVELILSDDGSTKDDTIQWLEKHKCNKDLMIIRNEVNQGIAKATNFGLLHANGEWVSFLDHDDLIAPNGLKAIFQALQIHPETSFLYTDEIIVDDELKIISSFSKPAFDPVLLRGMNYINHFSVYKYERLKEIGFLREGLDGSQDYDLLLRYLQGQDERTILHLPYPAYFWRRAEQSYSQVFLEKALAHARKTLLAHSQIRGYQTEIIPALNPEFHRTNYVPENGAWPSIGIVIPSRNSFSLISHILHDLFTKTDYPNFNVIVVDNGSTDDAVLNLYAEFSSRYENFSFSIVEEEFNFSRAINRGVSLLDCEHVLLLNNDVEVIEDQWLKEMVTCLAMEQVGIVGAKLLYPDNTIQHAGVIVGVSSLASHWFYQKPDDAAGPMERFKVRNSMSCVTGAVMLIAGKCLKEIGQWDEEHFAVAYNDVDYCLRAHKGGFRIVWTPFACLYHHESVSRGSDFSAANRKRYGLEKENLKRIHQTASYEDPASHPFFSRRSSTAEVVPPKTLSKPRRWFE